MIEWPGFTGAPETQGEQVHRVLSFLLHMSLWLAGLGRVEGLGCGAGGQVHRMAKV